MSREHIGKLSKTRAGVGAVLVLALAGCSHDRNLQDPLPRNTELTAPLEQPSAGPTVEPLPIPIPGISSSPNIAKPNAAKAEANKALLLGATCILRLANLSEELVAGTGTTVQYTKDSKTGNMNLIATQQSGEAATKVIVSFRDPTAANKVLPAPDDLVKANMTGAVVTTAGYSETAKLDITSEAVLADGNPINAQQAADWNEKNLRAQLQMMWDVVGQPSECGIPPSALR